MKLKLTLFTTFLLLIIAGTAFCQSSSITLEDAQKFPDAAQSRAQQDNWNVVHCHTRTTEGTWLISGE